MASETKVKPVAAAAVELAAKEAPYKADLSKYHRVIASRVSSANMTEDEMTGEVKYTISFLINTNGQSKRYTRECTKEVFKKVYGYHPDNNPNTLPVGGYATLVGRNFYVYLADKDKRAPVVALSCLPAAFYHSRESCPERLKENRSLELIYFADGSFVVPWTRDSNDTELPNIPAGISLNEFGFVTAQIDKQEDLVVGQQLYQEWKILSKNGNHVFIGRY